MGNAHKEKGLEMNSSPLMLLDPSLRSEPALSLSKGWHAEGVR